MLQHDAGAFLSFESLQVPIFVDCVKAWTILEWIQIVVAHYQGMRISPFQFLQQAEHLLLLSFCARVCRHTVSIESTLIAYTDGVLVMPLAVSSDHIFRSSRFQFSVASDDVVVADAEVKPPLAMPRIHLCC